LEAFDACHGAGVSYKNFSILSSRKELAIDPVDGSDEALAMESKCLLD